MKQKTPIIICLYNNIISGVTSWAFKLKDAFKNHPDYEILLLNYVGHNGFQEIYDYNANNLDDIKAIFESVSPAIVVPNYIWQIYGEIQVPGIQYLGFCHSDTNEEYYYPLSDNEQHISQFIAVSPTCDENLKKILPNRASDITMLPYGVSIPHSLKRTYQTSPVRLIYGGRIIQEQKRVFDFIPLIQNLLKNNTDFVFNIVGEGPDCEELKARINAEVPTDRVSFWGRREPEEMAQIWRDHDVFIQVSDFEGTSVSMLEAMAQGAIPVVTAASSGVSSVLAHGENGLISPIGDMKALAFSISYLAQQQERIEKISKSVQTNSLRYSQDNYVQRFTSILDQIQANQSTKTKKENSSLGNQYLLCTAPHTGGAFVCKLLNQTNLAGYPQEYFNESDLLDWFKKFGADNFHGFAESLLRNQSTKNNVFGAMLTQEQAQKFLDSVNSNLGPNKDSFSNLQDALEEFFPNIKYIWLTRRNKVRQAIEYLISLQTEEYDSGQSINYDRLKLAKYDFTSINFLVRSLILKDVFWEDFFKKNNIEPLILDFEDLQNSTQKKLDDLLSFISNSQSFSDLSVDIFPEIDPAFKELVNDWFTMYIKENQKIETQWWKRLHTRKINESQPTQKQARVFNQDELEKILVSQEIPTGTVEPDDMRFIWDQIFNEKPNVYLELGVASGLSTAMTLEAMEFTNPKSTVIGIDLSERLYYDNRHQTGYLVEKLKKNIECNYELHLNKWAADIEDILEGRTVDCAFIDANHSHPWATLDTILLLPFLRQGGLLIYHDISLYLNPDWSTEIGPHNVFEYINDEKINQPLGVSRNIGAIRFNRHYTTYETDFVNILNREWTLGYQLDPELVEVIKAQLKKHYSAQFIKKFESIVEQQNKVRQSV